MKLKKVISKVWLYILLLIVMVSVVAMKKDYHMDEIFSYGLANNVGQTSIHPQYAPYTYETPAQAYLEYMVVEEGEPFSIANCWYNQERESSPPLYYFAVYLVSFFVKERFSRWTAASINLLFMLLTFHVFRKLLKIFGVKDKELTLYSLFFIFCPAILNIVSFFRMYTMAIFAATLLTYLIIKYRGHENIKFYISMVPASILAVLTQYYLIFYLFFISLIYGIFLLCNREWMKAVKYVLTMGIAGVLTYVIFPAIVDQLFSASRGAEGLENLQQGFDVHWQYFKEYVSIMNEQIFGNLGCILLLLAVLGISYAIFKKRRLVTSGDSLWSIALLVLPAVFYVVMVSKAAPYRTDRYVMAVYAVVILVFLLATRKIANLCLPTAGIAKKIVPYILCVVVLVTTWSGFHWKYLYLDSQKLLDRMETYRDVDGLCVLDVGWKISGNFNEIIKLGSITFFQDEISMLMNMEDLKSKDKYVLYVVNSDPNEILYQIYAICPKIKNCEYIGRSDYAEIYYLSSLQQ